MKGVLQIHVQAQRQAAFAYVADLENAPHWVLDLVSVTLETKWEPGFGSHYTETVQMDNLRNVAELEITECDPPHEFTHRDQCGPARFTSRFAFKPDNGGMLIFYHYTMCMTCLSILQSPLTNRWVRKNTDAAMATLRTILNEPADGSACHQVRHARIPFERGRAGEITGCGNPVGRQGRAGGGGH